MTRGILVALASLAGGASCAWADVETFRTPYSAAFPVTLPLTVALPQFDTQGGRRTLQRVQVEFHYAPNFQLTIENNSTSPQTTGGSYDFVVAGLAPGGVNLNGFVMSGTIPPHDLAPTDGVLGSGPDFFDFGRIALGARPSFDATSFSSYIGGGTFNTRVAFVGLNFTLPPIPPVNPFRVQVIDGRFEGDVGVTYTFVPAPGAMGVLLLGGGVLSRRRRHM